MCKLRTKQMQEHRCGFWVVFGQGSARHGDLGRKYDRQRGVLLAGAPLPWPSLGRSSTRVSELREGHTSVFACRRGGLCRARLMKDDERVLVLCGTASVSGKPGPAKATRKQALTRRDHHLVLLCPYPQELDAVLAGARGDPPGPDQHVRSTPRSCICRHQAEARE